MSVPSSLREVQDDLIAETPPVDEVLYRNERTLIVRRQQADGGHFIVKQASGAEAIARLRHEAAMLARLSDVDGVARLAPVTLPEDSLALVDEHGVSLSRVLVDDPLPLEAVITLAWRLARTLTQVHRHGIVHKDINPANILLVGPQRKPVLIDFNIASGHVEERPGFTHHNQIAGTMAYMAPEQTGRTGRAVDSRADLYALGVTLYELTLGRKPFENEDLLELIHDHLVRTPAAPLALRADLPVAWSDLIMRLLEKEPDRRYQTAEGLANDLLRLRDSLARGDLTPFELGQDDFPLRLSAPARQIGRDAEQEQLREALASAISGRRRALVVAGAPGVGKSALIQELQPMVTAHRGMFVSGKFDQYHHDGSSAIVQALRALGRLLLAEPEADVAILRERALHNLGANAGLGPSLLPEFSVLLGPVPRVSVADPVEAETRMIQASIDLLRAVVSPERPLVMVVDDLQWAPAVSLRFIDAMLMAGDVLNGLLLVGAFRDSEVDATHPLRVMLSRWQQLGVAPAVLSLSNLPPADTNVLIGEMLKLPPQEAERLGTTLRERTGGNPYDTVELINALRQDGLLVPHQGRWQWDRAAIGRYVGHSGVIDLLGRRLDRLPLVTREVLNALACLGSEVPVTQLEVAVGQSLQALDQSLAPALDDGLLVSETTHEPLVRFRHDRVQQAVFERLGPEARALAHLALARRFATHPEHAMIAAQQYLGALEGAAPAPDERRPVVALLRQAASRNRVLNYAVCERFLAAALGLMADIETPDDAALMLSLETDRHAALYGMARLDEADEVYAAIVRRCVGSPMALVDATAVQIAALSNRSRHKDAVAIGLDLLKQLGLDMPEDVKMAIGMALFKLSAWIAGDEKAQDLSRPEVTDPHILALAKLLSKTQVAAFFCAAKTGSWLTMESHRLWVEHGPCPSLMATLCSTPMQLVAILQDYQGAHTLARHLLAVGEARGYEPATSVARCLLGVSAVHWFEALEEGIDQYRKAREGLIRGGDLQYANFTFTGWTLIFDSSPVIDGCMAEIEAGFAFSARTGDTNFDVMHRPSRQLVKALRGEPSPGEVPGSFSDDGFNEAEHEARVSTPPSSGGAYFHAERALSAAIYGDTERLIRHAGAAMVQLPRIPGYHVAVWAYLFQSLALAERLRAMPADEQAPLLKELDACRDWLSKRAKDAPFNYLHLQRMVEAERAWAVGDSWGAAAGYNAAMSEVENRSRPWQAALITERAALFHLSQGLEHTGRPLLAQARSMYQAWGASGKVREMLQQHSFLSRGSEVRRSESGTRSTLVSGDAVDVMSVLRASQALSSETSLDKLRSRVAKVLCAMTGAASVLMVVRHEDGEERVLSEDAADLTVRAAEAQGLLPMSAYRYAVRTQEPLLINDATRDERFSRDPYLAGLPHCSLLLVPVLSHGQLRAVLVLENRQRRGAFSADRLETVSLIAGQLSVSLDNALLYDSLERKVAERTAALEAANQRLEVLSVTDALTGVANRRRFAEALDAEWLRARRTGTPIGLAMIDIDQFKLYNDHYGHQGGDACLTMVADAMKRGLRAGSDLIARYGGEEFVLLLPNTDLPGTLTVAERVRKAVAALVAPHAMSGHGIVTVSIGIVSFVPDDTNSASQFIEVADTALYAAKRGGRNQVKSGLS